jgi:hypothetical protein
MSWSNDQQAFWDWAYDATVMRAHAEGWTQADCVSALYQSQLLSFTVLPEGPGDFSHNTPWTDWVPPSKSRKRFLDAQANRVPDRVEQRVRARLCTSVDEAGLQGGTIVFATVVADEKNRKCLQLRRGADLLATMDVAKLQITEPCERVITVSPRPLSKMNTVLPVVFLQFETEKRIRKFCDALSDRS